jgi:SNF family Na+-dependent transporter
MSVTGGTFEPRARTDNSDAIVALVCGILSFVSPLGIVTAPLAVYFGLAGRRRAREGAPYEGLATAGVVLGLVGVVLVVLFFLFLVFFAVGSTTVVG